MKQELPPFLLKTLALVAKGYKHEAMANELKVTVGTVNTYVKRLKLRFKDEQELQDPNLSSELALRLIAQRYFNSSNQDSPPTTLETDTLVKQFHTFTPSSDLIEFLQDFSTQIYQVGLDGRSQDSVMLADELSRFLTEKEDIVSSKYRPPLLSIHADLLFYQGKTYTEFKFPSALFAFTTPVIKHLEDIAKQCADGEIFGLAHHLKGANYYHVDKRQLSIKEYSKSLEIITHTHRRLEAMRALAINYALLDELREVKRLVREAEGLIEELSASDQLLDLESATMTLEGFGRAQGLVKLPETFDTIQRGESVHKKIEAKHKSLPIRAIQLLKARLVAVQNLEPTNKPLLEIIANDGIALAQKFDYPKQESFIRKILKKAL